MENQKFLRCRQWREWHQGQKTKNLRWEQDVEGNAATFDAILCDNTAWKPSNGGGVQFWKRYTGGGRAFTKSGDFIFSDEEYKDGVGWRLSKEMEGSVLKWRTGARVVDLLAIVEENTYNK
ncbi:unnamed protein product [Fraxinus pennsylvanica]|uniref:Uncharacterized protein n=1 Tax=Fraxinus pennsylvanica TaxID=56036 RepID=A0AAD2A7R5_9LAMI|nr:unnamed protein product [Fraxinus pennsylvanica]